MLVYHSGAAMAAPGVSADRATAATSTTTTAATGGGSHVASTAPGVTSTSITVGTLATASGALAGQFGQVVNGVFAYFQNPFGGWYGIRDIPAPQPAWLFTTLELARPLRKGAARMVHRRWQKARIV